MPAVYESFLGKHDHPERIAWRLSFLVPCILQIVCGLAVLFLSDDTPTGSWSSRNLDMSRRPSVAPILQDLRSSNSSMTFLERPSRAASTFGKKMTPQATLDLEKGQATTAEVLRRGSEAPTLAEAQQGSPSKPTKRQILGDLCCVQTLMLASAYFSTFGLALLVNAILVNWLMSSEFKFGWAQGLATDWASSFGLLNFVTRPFGGLMGDVLYRRFGEQRGLVAKKCASSPLSLGAPLSRSCIG